MPTKKTRLSKMEEKEYRATRSELKNLGIECNFESAQESKTIRFKVQQIHAEFARVHDLPDGSSAVVLPAKLVVLASDVMFTDAEVRMAWDDWRLLLEEPREHRHFEEFTKDSPTYPPVILNRLLASHRPLRRCQAEGLLIGTDGPRIPSDYADERPLKFVLCLADSYDEEYYFEFIARVDRRLKRMYERQRPGALTLFEMRAKRVPLVSREKAEAAGTNQCHIDDSKIQKTSMRFTNYRRTI